jgi:hypothetical protein
MKGLGAVRKRNVRTARVGQCRGRGWLGDMSLDFAITARHRLQECKLVQVFFACPSLFRYPKTCYLQSGRFMRVIQNEPVARDTT